MRKSQRDMHEAGEIGGKVRWTKFSPRGEVGTGYQQLVLVQYYDSICSYGNVMDTRSWFQTKSPASRPRSYF